MTYTARITSGPDGLRADDGYDVVEMVTAQGTIACTLHVRHHDGMVTWSDKWDIWPDLEADGHLRHAHRGPNTYGHVDVYFV